MDLDKNRDRHTGNVIQNLNGVGKSFQNVFFKDFLTLIV